MPSPLKSLQIHQMLQIVSAQTLNTNEHAANQR